MRFYKPRHLDKNEKPGAFSPLLAGVALLLAVSIVVSVGTVGHAFGIDWTESTPAPTNTVIQGDTHAVNELTYRNTKTLPTPTPILYTDAAAQLGQILTEEVKTTEFVTTRLGIPIDSYDSDVDYTVLMMNALEEAKNAENPDYALACAEIYEESRNLKITSDPAYAEYQVSHNFSLNSGLDVNALYELYHGKPSYYPYTEDELIAVARIVYGEAGSSFISDAHQRDVASVILNRVADGRFGGHTIMGVIQRPGQYATRNNTRYDERSLENARYVLENGPTIDALYQANFKQGTKTLRTYSYPGMGVNTAYLCK